MDDNDKGPMAALVLNVHTTYPFVLLGIALHCLICNSLLLTVIRSARKKYFTAELMQKFVDEHKKAYPEDGMGIDMSGNPDQGMGWYSKEMTMEQWHGFNRSNRAHQVWLENLPFVILLPPISGVLFPYPTLVCVYVMLVCRIMFVIGYVNPKVGWMRAAGHGVFQVCVTVLVVCSIMCAARVMQFGDEKFEKEEKKIWDHLEELRKKYDV